MSQTEHELMVTTGQIQPTVTGLEMKHVTAPPDSSAFSSAPAGSVFVEFDIVDAQVSPGGNAAWLIVYGPNSIQGRLVARRGLAVAGLPRVENVMITERN
jgi:hypothetical protein